MLKKEIRKEVNKKNRVKKTMQIRAFALANPYNPRAIIFLAQKLVTEKLTNN